MSLMAEYLAAHLHDFGIAARRVVVAPDLNTMMEYLKTGQDDLYFDSPYPALAVYEEIGRDWRPVPQELFAPMR